MKHVLATALLMLGIAGCGGGNTSVGTTSLDEMLDSHPTFERVVCQTVDQYGYQAALEAANDDWAAQLSGTDLSPKQALDTIIARCD